MIARIWHGKVATENADAYYQFLINTGLPDYRDFPGHRGTRIMKREDGAVTHFLLITLWDSIDAIRAFAGEDMEKARYYAEDRRLLLDLPPFVRHYEVLDVPGEPEAGTGA